MKIGSLDFLRVYGSILIFLCHLVWFDIPTGSLGVTLFFVISGFVTNISTRDKEVKFLPYIGRKLKRLYPLYILTTLLGGAYMLGVLHLPLSTTLIKFPIFAAMLQTVVPFVQPTGFNSPSWYVASLMCIYVVYAGVKSLKINRYMGIAMFAVYIVLLFTLIGPFLCRCGISRRDIFYFSPLSRIIDFGGGYLAGYAAIAYRKLKISRGIDIAAQTIGLIILICMTLGWIGLSIYSQTILMALLCILWSRSDCFIVKWISTRAMAVLSEHTYSFYLIHYLVIMTFVHTILYALPSRPDMCGFIAISLGCFIVSALLSYLLNIYDSGVRKLLDKKRR